MIESALNIPASQNELSSDDSQLTGGSVHRWTNVTQRIANQGDREAFAEYYDAFFDTMFFTVRQATGCDESTCLDIVQDAMVKAIRKMKVLDSHQKAAAWSSAVAKTTAYDFLRKQARQRKLSQGLVESTSDVEMDDVDSVARLAWVEEQLQQLPAELGSMISLKYRMGWTLRQIGEKFGMKTGAVDGKIRRAMAELKQKADKEFENE